MDEITNLWKEFTDENVVKTWLLGLTDGQTFSINNHFLPKIKTPLIYGNFDRIKAEWDEIIGSCPRCHIDDETLETRTKEIVSGLNAFIERINANPEKYFGKAETNGNAPDGNGDEILDRIAGAIDGMFGCVESVPGCIYIDEDGVQYAVSIMKCNPCEEE